MTPSQRRFLLDVEAHPFDVLRQDHTRQTIGECVAKRWASRATDGTFTVTQAGAAALGVTA